MKSTSLAMDSTLGMVKSKVTNGLEEAQTFFIETGILFANCDILGLRKHKVE